jgi:hypothetical protein
MNHSDEDIKRLEDAANLLGEHFDSVRIFATRYDPSIEKGTVTANAGVGNWYASYGQVREWLIKHDEFARLDARKCD